MLVEKIITHRKALLGYRNGLRQTCRIGIGIGQYKRSGLRQEKILVGIAGLKNHIEEPLHSDITFTNYHLLSYI